MYFRNLVLSAFAIAIVAGLFLSIYQEVFITPIILASETYEVVMPEAGHAEEAWGPEDGSERSSFNFLSNFLVCFAFSQLLLSAMTTRNAVKPIQGIFWGGAAYLSVFAAPALGLPPEIPGMEAAYLEGRQVWWLFTVASTATALWLLAFSDLAFKGIGALALTIPHIIGAPQPVVHGFVNSDPSAVSALTRLWHEFIVQTSLANALLWLIIGISAAILANLFIYPLEHQE